MKILSLHCDYLKYKPLKKAVKKPEELNEEMKKETIIEEPLGIFVAVEKADEKNPDRAANELVKNVLDLLDKTKAKRVVLYPYAHLSSDLADPDVALLVLVEAETKLNKNKIEVYRAPFGYYKEFELKCKGHPLAELSREIKAEGEKVIEIKKTEEKNYDEKQLLKQISKSKLDTSKLKENDHRIIGKKLDLFSFNEAAPGMVFWHNNGLVIYNELISFWREVHKRAAYQEISTPQILDKKLWQVSGHWEKYKDNIFLTDYENRIFAVKPMNCPGGMLVYKATQKSYKDLPLKVGELGIVHRQELSGVLSGLFRVIKFTQDDAHIFCTEEQVDEEIENIIKLINKFYTKFSLEFDHVELSTRPEKRIGSDETWTKAENVLESVLKKQKIKYKINKGDGAFYGPKIDFHVKDSLGRTWQLSTIQLDFAMPEKFELEYTDKNNEKKRPVMLHRVVYGSLERFIGILIEHTHGNLPLWLSPIQIRVLSFTDRNIEACKKLILDIAEKIPSIRIDADFSSTTVNDKVRSAEMLKIPYIITIGDKEEEKKTIVIRERGDKKLRTDVKANDFVQEILEKITKRE
ncbi:MAG: threonine--tRNA ligase [Candidatus Pacearchaeota archaeon]